MTCSECEVQIFEGDLDRDAVVHLTACDDCRTLDREVRLNVAALAELRDEVISVRPKRRPLWPWAVAAVAAAIVAVAVWPTPAPVPVPAVQIAKVEPLPTAPALPAVVKPAPIRRAHHVRPKPAPLTAKAAEPLMVKFFTDDPDVVIYWLIDPPKGDIGL